jgi:hypothetical protein
MFETAILILLYNKEITDSNTINSLINSGVQYPNAKLVIWNNGPVSLKNRDCVNIENLGYDVYIAETLNNESLAVVYNKFLSENTAKNYILLDDDSNINSEYILSSSKNKVTEVGMPIISSHDVVRSPKVNEQPYSPEIGLTPNDKVITIGSGLVIGKEILAQLMLKYDRVFDDRFFLYCVDSTFCLRLFESKLTNKISIIPGFNHSLSRLEIEDFEKTKFRLIERSCSAGLLIRYYNPLSSALLKILLVGLVTIKRMLFRQNREIYFLVFLKAILVGKHYRSI